MRTERITIYIAEDGRRFSKERECREYEKKAEIIEFIAKNKTDASEILSLFKGRYTLI